MKRKISLIVFMTVLLLTASAFQFNGVKKEAVAEGKENQAFEHNDAQPLPDPKIKSNSTAPVGKLIPLTSTEKTPKSQAQPQKGNKPQPVEEDTFNLDGDLYRLAMDKTKFDPNSRMGDFIDAAVDYGVKIYGLDNSDSFIFVKGGKMIGGFSAGLLWVMTEHADLVKEMLPEERKENRGIEDNIDLVLETGAKVSVSFENEGYSLSINDGYLQVDSY